MSDMQETNTTEKKDDKSLRISSLSIVSVMCFLLGVVSLDRVIPLFTSEEGNKMVFYLPDITTYIFSVLAVILGIVAILKIKKHLTLLSGRRLAIFGIFMGLLLLLYSFYIKANYWLEETSYEVLMLRSSDNKISKLGELIIRYANDNNGILPKADSWCDLLINYDEDLTRDDFKHPESKGYECDFAFNKNMSEVNILNIPEDTILLFESSGKWNLNGSEELISSNLKNRKWYLRIFCVGGYIRTYNIKSKKFMENSDDSMPLWKP